MRDKADRAGTEMETSNAQERPLTNAGSQHYQVPSDLQPKVRPGDMTEARGNGDTASEAPRPSSKIFTMLGKFSPIDGYSNVPRVDAIRKQPRGHE